MIFAAATDERSLMVFASEKDAASYCEGLDVEAGDWLFWDAAGEPLEPQFVAPNKRGRFIVANGQFRLVPSSHSHRASLAEALDVIATFEGPPPFTSAAAVRDHLQNILQSARQSTNGQVPGGEI